MAIAFAAGRTEKGEVRKTNDDAFRVYCDNDTKVKRRGFIFAVADGIGSYRAGGQAAEIAVDQLSLYFRYPADQFKGDKTAEELIFKANSVVTDMRTGQEQYYGMGCTLTVLLTDPQVKMGIVYQVGDSMAYMGRGGRLVPITIAQQADDGSLANHLGLGGDFKFDRTRFFIAPGDSFLLCSDGMCGCLDNEVMQEGLLLSDDPQTCLDFLFEKALAVSEDNVTAVVVKVR